MSKRPTEYGIMTHNAITTDLHKFSANSPQRERTVLLGQILRIEGVLGAGNYAVKYLKQDGVTWESAQFGVEQSKVGHVSEKLWQFILAVPSPQERVRIAKVPNHSEKLLSISKESTVEVLIDEKIYLGSVKYIGEVHGLGPGYYYGIQLHEKRVGNNCNGTYNSISYFHCLPGFGTFASINQLVITPTATTTQQPNTVNNVAVQQHINSLTAASYNSTSNIPPSASGAAAAVKATAADAHPAISGGNAATSHLFRASSSLQNINSSVNSSSGGGAAAAAADVLLRADRTYPDNAMMMGGSSGACKTYTSEIDLIDAIGGTWPAVTGSSSPPPAHAAKKSAGASPLETSYAELKLKPKNSTNSSSMTNVSSTAAATNGISYSSATLGAPPKHARNRSANFMSHLVNGPGKGAQSAGAAHKRTKEFVGRTNGSAGTAADRTAATGKDSKPDEDLKKILNEHLAAISSSNNHNNNNNNHTSSSNNYHHSSQAAAVTAQAQEKKVQILYEPIDTFDDLGTGSLVEVSQDVSDEPLYGVIRWLGAAKGAVSSARHVLAGVELEEDLPHLPLTLTNGTHCGQKYFSCSANRALFVPLDQCHKDSRFQEPTAPPHHDGHRTAGANGLGAVGPGTSNGCGTKLPGQPDCPVVEGSVPPLSMPTEGDVEAVCGKFRGIQGHHNSCYLDATLFAMFTYTAVFDSLLYRPKGPADIAHYEEVQRVLREEIVNPLRTQLYVSADKVMNLRKLLDELSSVSGLTSEEKDPEEFLNSLLAQILKAEPFLKLSSGQEAYHYQLFVEKDEDLELPSVQQLFEQSFLSSDIKLKEVPSCLIIQMPRFGKSYKMYPRIIPSQLLDVTDIIENSPRQCTVCGKLAHFECRECLGECGVGLESTGFCRTCLETAHSHARRSQHRPRALAVPKDFTMMTEACGLPPPRLYMELFAVVCIETSHYVAFVKCGSGHEAPWCFFDSMADRKGEQNGYNIPEMVACPDVSCWLSDESMCRQLHDKAPLDRHLPEHARRLLCDAYICMYQSPDVMMYR